LPPSAAGWPGAHAAEVKWSVLPWNCNEISNDSLQKSALQGAAFCVVFECGGSSLLAQVSSDTSGRERQCQRKADHQKQMPAAKGPSLTGTSKPS